jgi:hypothetical protein
VVSPHFLARSAKRTAAGHLLTQLTPGVDGLLFADLLDLLSGAILRAASLDDDQAREVLALMWSGPR